MNFQELLIDWYNKNKRDLPFRNTNNPYYIWVSEIMLQQTTVTAVIPYYNKFIKLFPSVNDLANASIEEVYKVWEGLGYYRRAKHIHESSKEIVKLGYFPNTYEELLKLKGIGPYTASAISSFAYHLPYSAIDGNALRVLSRVYEIKDNIALNKTITKITKLSNKLIIGYDSSSYNQGLMDFANIVCKVKNPKCDICPISHLCLSYKHNTQKVLPINIKNIKHKEELYITGIITYKDQYMFTFKEEGLLENMYHLVQYDVESPFAFIEKFKDEYHIDLICESYIKDFKHVFTHKKWKMSVYHFISNKPLPNSYKDFNIPIPKAHSKILDYYLKAEI